MTTGTGLLIQATQILRAAGVDDPARDARVLLAHSLGIDRARLTLVLPDEVAQSAKHAYARAIKARAARQPVAQITGTRAFFGRDFIVTGDVLDPRPETERLVEAALSHPFGTVLDLGVGSGCILLTLLAENPAAMGQGVDLSEAALTVAQQNANALGLQDRAKLALGSWFEPLAQDTQFDLIVSNPPYICEHEMNNLSPEVQSWEPRMALTPGGDGLAPYRLVTAGAQRHLRPFGRLMVEIGATQGSAVRDMFKSAGFTEIRVLSDLDGRDRVVVGQNPN